MYAHILFKALWVYIFVYYVFVFIYYILETVWVFYYIHWHVCNFCQRNIWINTFCLFEIESNNSVKFIVIVLFADTKWVFFIYNKHFVFINHMSIPCLYNMLQCIINYMATTMYDLLKKYGFRELTQVNWWGASCMPYIRVSVFISALLYKHTTSIQ